MKKNIIVPICKVMHIKKEINVWVANVCSISGKTDVSAKRKDFLIDRIKAFWPDFIILVETNHTAEPSILTEIYDNFYTPFCESQGVIILAKKLFGCIQTAYLENRGIVIKSRIIKDFTIVGIYCPYYNLRSSTIEFLKWHQTGHWLIAGDLESFGNYIIQRIDSGFWGDIDFTRESNESKTRTEYVGFFYSKPIIERLDKISDHFIINGKFDTKWDGIKITWPQQIARNKAICTVMNYYSKATSELLAEWPENPFKNVVAALVPLKTREIKIYKKNISICDINSEMAKNYKKEKRKKILLSLENALISNNLKSVASITSKILHITRKGKSSMSILGILGQDEKIYVGDDSLKLIKEFYGDLFTEKSQTNIIKEKITFKPIEFSENLFEKALAKLSKHKAMGWDQFPDELLDLPFIKKKFKKAFQNILKTGIIPDYLKYGRLCLLSKEKSNSFPKIENTRPIIILSAIYKLLELYWFLNIEELVWKNIGYHQIGFRKKGSTQFNVCSLKNWMNKEKHGILLFVDIKKAYDHVIREKLYNLLSFIGVTSSLVQFYINLTSNMRVYLSEKDFIEYTRGVPQGSCISPALFNLYYEEALKKLTPFTELLLGFADDIVGGINSKHSLEKTQTELKNWAHEYNLFVHDTKTECILYYIKKPENLRYPICEKFRYLGIDIYNKKSQFTKTFILNHISHLAKNCKRLTFGTCPVKINKLMINWWFLSKLLYDQISNLFLGYLPLPEFHKITVAKIKMLLNINKNVPQKFVLNLLNLDIEQTVKNMLTKMKENCPFKLDCGVNLNSENDKIAETKDLEENRYWNYVMTTFDMDVNSFYSVFQRTWWKKNEGRYKCRLCNTDLSLFHLYKSHIESYPFLKSMEFKWILELAENYDFKGSLLRRKIGKEIAATWMKKVIEESLDHKQKAIKELGILLKNKRLTKKEKNNKEVKLQNKNESKKDNNKAINDFNNISDNCNGKNKTKNEASEEMKMKAKMKMQRLKKGKKEIKKKIKEHFEEFTQENLKNK